MPPELFSGDTFVDDRGTIGFVNDFRFEGIQRFYWVINHHPGTVRAWHGHKREHKYVFAVSGTSLVACVEIDDWAQPSPSLQVHRFVLSEQKPAILHIPAGYANGFMSLTADSKLILFSTSTLEESSQDDYRFPARHWDPWSIEER